MFADPLSVQLAGNAVNHPRITMDSGLGNFRTTVSGITQNVTIKQSSTKARFRSEFRISDTKIASDPLTSNNIQVGSSVYLVIDRPISGFTDAELVQMVTSLVAFLSAGSYANVNKLLAGEY